MKIKRQREERAVASASYRATMRLRRRRGCCALFKAATLTYAGCFLLMAATWAEEQSDALQALVDRYIALTEGAAASDIRELYTVVGRVTEATSVTWDAIEPERRKRCEEIIETICRDFPRGPRATRLQREAALARLEIGLVSALHRPLFQVREQELVSSQIRRIVETAQGIIREQWPHVEGTWIGEDFGNELERRLHRHMNDPYSTAFKIPWEESELRGVLADIKREFPKGLARSRENIRFVLEASGSSEEAALQTEQLGERRHVFLFNLQTAFFQSEGRVIQATMNRAARFLGFSADAGLSALQAKLEAKYAPLFAEEQEEATRLSQSYEIPAPFAGHEIFPVRQ